MATLTRKDNRFVYTDARGCVWHFDRNATREQVTEFILWELP